MAKLAAPYAVMDDGKLAPSMSVKEAAVQRKVLDLMKMARVL